MKNYLLFICLVGAIQLGVAQISGTVYQDLPVNGTTLNTYGVKDANELGVEGVTVTVFPGGMTAMTAADGTYTIAGAPAGAIRIEFSAWPSYLQESTDGGSANSSVQFTVAPATNVDFGLHNPDDFFDNADPTTTTPMHINGDPLAGGNAGTYVTWPFWSYSDDESTVLPASSYAIAAETGAMWGVGYSKAYDQLFASAVLRRHAGFGPLGIGGVYTVTSARTSPSFAQWLDVETLGIDVGTDSRNALDPCNALSGDTADPSYDVQSYTNAGRTGLGDIDVSEDGKTLYIVDLHNKQVLGINIASKTMKSGFPIAIPDPGCGGGDYRPWAVEENNGQLYVGVVCSGETSQSVGDLTANVMASANGGAFSTVFTFSLQYARNATVFSSAAEWNPWNEGTIWRGDSYPQPILSGIVFDVNGDMILGFVDRNGLTTGNNNYDNSCANTSLTEGHSGGDMLRACKTGASTWVLESNGSCGGVTTAGMDADPGSDAIHIDEGPGGGEYYWQDGYGHPAAHVAPLYNHSETFIGGLGFLPGSGQVISSLYDPKNPDSGGVGVFDNTIGDSPYKYELHSSEGGPGPHAGKSGGIGDIELLTPPAPIEIGNLVWDDANSNGEQDPDEAGIAGVTVELLDAGGTVITSAMTDANGNYIFSNDPNGTSTASHIYNITALNPNTVYTLRVPTTNGGNNLTTANGAGGKDIIDSDANTATGVADVLAADIPVLGANNHSFDFGYGPPPVGCSIAVTSATPTACDPATNTYDLAVVVTYSTPPAGNINVTTDNGGSMSVAQTGSPQTITLTGLTSDGVAAIDVTAVFDGDTACTDTSIDAYDAPASCAIGCPPPVCGTVTVVKN